MHQANALKSPNQLQLSESNTHHRVPGLATSVLTRRRDFPQPSQPESATAKSDVDSKRLMTPVVRPVVFEEVATPHTAEVLLEGEMVWRHPSLIPSFSTAPLPTM
ncbi:uncharacterized protein FFB14_06379 [Fusarium fujikuroi]|nr:uncharacterized protein FFB14_06379 [Fusarium fujikuroi]